jgi:predicted anti-sigma-YlaC factor YlaD
MDCKEVIGKLLDLLDGQLSSEAEQAIRAHLAECEKCRSEHHKLHAAHQAVAVAAQDLAPPREYATPERVERLMGAVRKQKRSRRITRLYRTAMATAAVVAIAICAPIIGSDVLQMMRQGQDTGTGDPAVAIVQPERVMVAPGGADAGITALRPVRMEQERSTPRAAPRPHVAKLDTEGVEVPVDHAFYDADESARWW